MTLEEAREAIKLEGGLALTGKPERLKAFFRGLEVADKALEEVQQYRATKLSPEQVRALQNRSVDVFLLLGKYTAIGTPEECRAAVEKQRPEKPICTRITVTILSAYVLHEKFGFGKTRLDRFIHEFNFQSECLMDDYFTWEDQIEVLRQECGLNLEIRKNDKDVRI